MARPSARTVGIGAIIVIVVAAVISLIVVGMLAIHDGDAKSRIGAQTSQTLEDNGWTRTDSRDVNVDDNTITTQVDFGTNGCHFDVTAPRNHPQQITFNLRRMLGRDKTIPLIPYAVALNEASSLGVGGCLSNK